MSTAYPLPTDVDSLPMGRGLLGLVNSLDPSAFVASLKLDGELIHANAPALAYIACSALDVVGRHFAETPWWQGSETARRRLHRAIKLAQRGQPSRFTQQAKGPDGIWHTRNFIMLPVYDLHGHVAQLMASSVAVSAPTLAHQAPTRQIDSCTGLPDRSELRQYLTAALEVGREVGLMLIGLDRFKRINDALGQAAGDELLRLAGDRLQVALPEAELVARMGGDEFAVLISDSDLTGEGERIMQAFAHPFELSGREVFVSCSIGCTSTTAACSEGDCDASELVRQGATALLRAKAAGRNGLHIFAAAPDELDPDALTLESALRRAVELGQLRLHYQPQIDLATGRIVGAEALLRWSHPELGEIAPTRFIPIAEESGLIMTIGDWVLEEAITTAAAWRQAGLPPIRIAVNLSGRQLHQPGLGQSIEQMLANHALDPGWLAVEVTESMLVHNFAQTSATLRHLKTLGIEVAIDDFGTGYCGLNYLRNLPIDVVKIDRCFIPDVTEPPDKVSMTRALIQLAHSLQLRVVAEGIETHEHRILLAEQRCDFAQGFLFGAAMPSDILHARLHRQAADRS